MVEVTPAALLERLGDFHHKSTVEELNDIRRIPAKLRTNASLYRALDFVKGSSYFAICPSIEPSAHWEKTSPFSRLQ